MFGKKKGRSKKGAAAPEPSGAGGLPAGAAGPSPGEPGSSIGRYTIESTLGQGGMGRVYLARDPVIGRNVALKVITIRPDLSDEEAGQYRERFLREAQAAGALIHPNIVAVHDIGKDSATGSPYIVMEHVPGQDLKKVILSRAPLEQTEAIGIVMQIAAALDYAHRRGIVHRDIKPANVLLTEQGRVKITDFGVARLPGSDLTRSDQFVGSPGFMSPEQLKGASVDGRSDLFALGVILYELLTGKAPFDGESVSEVLYRISTQPAEPPSETHTSVSPDLDPVLERALAKDPAARYQTGADMNAALSPFVQEEAPMETARAPVADASPAASHGTSPWFTLSSQWRLGALMTILVLALVGVNWGIVALFKGPLGRSVRLAEAREKASTAGGRVGIAGTLPPPDSDRAAGWMGNPRQSMDAARRELKAAHREMDIGLPDAIQSDTPIRAVCAMSYAGPSEMARLVEAARRARPGRTVAASLSNHASGKIRLEVTHRMKAGRLIVLMDGRTVYSRPFESRGKSGTITHLLSVPAGRHGFEVRLLEDKGGLVAKSKINGSISRNEMALLTGEQRAAGRKALDLDWHVSH